MSVDELRESWQGRALRAYRYQPLGMPLVSVIANSWDDALLFLMAAVFPGFMGITPPFCTSIAHIDKAGRVCTDVLWADWTNPDHAFPLFRDTKQMEGEFRKLADMLKFSDQERNELFAAVKKWCASDRRLDPTFDPADPDAKRLTVH